MSITTAQARQLAVDAGFTTSEAAIAAGIARQESGLDPRESNPSGARGLMQIMLPLHTARLHGGDPYDPAVSMRAAREIYLAAGSRWTPWSVWTDPAKRAQIVAEASGAPSGPARASDRLGALGGVVDGVRALGGISIPNPIAAAVSAVTRLADQWALVISALVLLSVGVVLLRGQNIISAGKSVGAIAAKRLP
jgi:hypothetical protein